MNLLKKIFIVSACSIFLSYGIFQNAFGYICVNATSNYKMFGSVLRAKVLKNPFIMAFRDEQFKSYKIFYANNDTQLVNQIQKMTSEECSILLGLFTSQDCLISGPILKKNRIIGFSSSCSDDQISKFFPYVYTAVPKLSDFSKEVAKYINRTKTMGVIYAFYQPSDIYSSSGFNAFKKYIKKTLISVPVSSSGNFNLKALKQYTQGQSSIIFFTYPLPSAQILVTLDANHLINDRVNIIGASSWIFDISVFKPIDAILKKAKSVLTPSLVNQERIDSSKFAHKFKMLYHREPDVVEVLTYDITRLSTQCYKNIMHHGNYSNQAFLNCIRNNNYDGVSGYSKFQKHSPFSIRKIYLINLLRWIQ